MFAGYCTNFGISSRRTFDGSSAAADADSEWTASTKNNVLATIQLVFILVSLVVWVFIVRSRIVVPCYDKAGSSYRCRRGGSINRLPV